MLDNASMYGCSPMLIKIVQIAYITPLLLWFRHQSSAAAGAWEHVPSVSEQGSVAIQVLRLVPSVHLHSPAFLLVSGFSLFCISSDYELATKVETYWKPC